MRQGHVAIMGASLAGLRTAEGQQVLAGTWDDDRLDVAEARELAA